MEKVKLLRVPQKCMTREMLIGTISKMENIKNILVLVEDDTGVWIMSESETTLERMNWMLDRAKYQIHG